MIVFCCRFSINKGSTVSYTHLVGNVPPQRPKLPPLLDISMEEAEGEEEGVPGLRFATTLIELIVSDRVIKV